MKFKQETEFQKTETEIGKIPREWRIVRLIEVAEVRGGKKLPENVESVVFIPMEAVPDNSLYVNYVIRNADEVKSYVYCEPGDLLVAKITPSFENGKQGIVPYDLPGKFALATTEVYSIKCNNIDTLFLFYLLKYPPIRSKLASLMRGTTGRRRVPREALENTLLPYPPIHEQKRIAEILSTLDKAIEVLDAGVVRLEGLKKALMRELLTGRIRVREENDKLVFYRETEFQDTEIGKIPREWKIERLGHIVKYVKGKKPSALFDERPSEEYVPYLTAEYMRGLDKPKWCNSKLENNIIEVFHDDVIMIWDGSYAGHVFTGFNGILASTMVKIIPVVKLDKKFLYYYLLANFEEFRSTTVGTGVPHVNKKVFEEFPTPVPPIHEQKRIAEILSTVDRAIELYREERVRLDRLKRGLMDLLLTGKVRVGED